MDENLMRGENKNSGERKKDREDNNFFPFIKITPRCL